LDSDDNIENIRRFTNGSLKPAINSVSNSFKQQTPVFSIDLTGKVLATEYNDAGGDDLSDD